MGVMGELSSDEPGPEDISPLIDLGDISLDDVARMDDSALVHSLNRILGDAANPDEVILASFSASV
jgi:FXSXX-COOH protein